MPVDGGQLLLAVVGLEVSQLALHLLLRLRREVDVGNLEVDGGDELNAGDAGDDAEGLWVLPRIVHEWCIPVCGSSLVNHIHHIMVVISECPDMVTTETTR